MKKLMLKLDGKEMLSKEQMKKLVEELAQPQLCSGVLIKTHILLALLTRIM